MYIRIIKTCRYPNSTIWLQTTEYDSDASLYGGDPNLNLSISLSNIYAKKVRLVRGNAYAIEINSNDIELKYIYSIDCILKNLFKDSPNKVGFLAMKYKKGGYTPANKISKFAKSLFSSIIKYDPKIIFDAASWIDVEKQMAKVLNSIIKGSVLDDTKEDSK
jgi:hypothetical protein